MKKSIKFTAAAAAAIMLMSCTSLTTFANTTVEAANDDTSYVETLVGGWSVNNGSLALSKNREARAAFKDATADLVGASYTPIAVLGTQVVAGTNYAILCKETAVYPDAEPEIKIMYIYEDLEGNAEITGFKTIIGESAEGGFSANKGKLALSQNKNKKVYSAFKKAISGTVGTTYKPVAYLGRQVVAGDNYLILCKSKAVTPNASNEWSLVTVYRDLKGKASLLDTETIELGDMDPDEDDYDGDFLYSEN